LDGDNEAAAFVFSDWPYLTIWLLMVTFALIHQLKIAVGFDV
jgi:hypothetical protein